MRLVHTEEIGKMVAVSEIPTSPLQPRSRGTPCAFEHAPLAEYWFGAGSPSQRCG